MDPMLTNQLLQEQDLRDRRAALERATAHSRYAAAPTAPQSGRFGGAVHGSLTARHKGA